MTKNLVCVQLIWLECMNDFLDQTLFTSQLFSYNFKKIVPNDLPIFFLTSFKNFFCCNFFEIFISKNYDFSILRFLPLPNQSKKNFLTNFGMYIVIPPKRNLKTSLFFDHLSLKVLNIKLASSYKRNVKTATWKKSNQKCCFEVLKN